MPVLSDLTTPLAAALTNAGEWVEGVHRIDEHSAPPRYVLERVDITIGGAQQTKNANALGVVQHRCRIHCWGRDESHAERLMQALDTALRDSVALSAAQVTGASWTADAWVRDGAAITVDVTFSVPRVRAAVAANGTITDKLPTFVTIGAVAFQGGTAGDGVLDLPNT